MKNLKKKGFTIVELVIVIAVIAVLATVLIPSFSNIINNSQISADKSTVSNLNKQISVELVDKEIESASDLERIIKKIFGEKYYDNLKPNSASQGYNFWFNTKTKKVELKKYDESFESKMMNLSVTTKTFDETNFRQFGDYYLLDQGGSDFADAIKGLETLKTSEDYIKVIELINKIISNVNNHHYSQTTILAEKVANTAIIGDNGTFRYSDYATVTNVLFVSGIETINSNLYLYNGTEVTSTSSSEENPIANVLEITLPNTVKSVEGSSLYFKVEKTVKIYGSFATIEEVKSIFKAYSTNGIIMCEETGGLILNGSVLEDLNGNSQGNLGYSNPVASFDISCEETDKIKYVSGTLYVAYDQKEFQLNVENFVGENPNSNISSEEVSWSSDNSDVLNVDENGKVTIERIPSVGEVAEYTLTATAIAGGHQETITVCVVRINSAVVTVDGNSTNADNEITIEYNGSTEDYDLNILLYYNDNTIIQDASEPKFDLDDDVSFETSGNIFDINNGKISLKEHSGEQTFKVKVGNYLEQTIKVTIKDVSKSPFTLKFANNYLYRVGNSNVVSMNTLFEYKEENLENKNVYISIIDKLTGRDVTSDYLKTTNTSNILNDKGEVYVKGENFSGMNVDFSGYSGVVSIKLIVLNKDITLNLEVIDGKNVTEYSDLTSSGNLVILKDIKFSNIRSFSSANIYGNGFTFNVEGLASGTEGVINLVNTKLDNIKIVASIYPKIVNQHGSYYSAAVKVAGGISDESVISNSFIAGGSSAIHFAGGNLTIDNTTLYGGTKANLWVFNSARNLVIKDLTTVQVPLKSNIDLDGDGIKDVMGIGIYVESEEIIKNSTTSLEIKGYLKQYNWVKKDSPNSLSGTGQAIINEILGNNKYSRFIINDSFNSGLIFVADPSSNGYLRDNREDKVSISYSLEEVKLLSATGYVYSCTSSSLLEYDGVNMTDNVKFESKQAPYEPKCNITYPTYTDSSNPSNYYEYDNDKKRVVISFEEGGLITYKLEWSEGELTKKICTVSKYGSNINVDIYIGKCDANGNVISYEKITNNKIDFKEAGNYKIKISYTDSKVYGGTSASLQDSISYTKYIDVIVYEISKEVELPEFTFTNKNSQSVKGELIVADNGTNYISAMVTDNVTYSATDVDATWGYKEVQVGGITQKVYFPIINGTDDGEENLNRYHSIFDGITIKEGEKVYNNSSINTVELFNANFVNESPVLYSSTKEGKFSENDGTSIGNNGNRINTISEKLVVDSGYYNTSSGTGDSLCEIIAYIKYTFTDNNNNKYVYYIGYHFDKVKKGSNCVTPDTLITLANGTQVAVKDLTGTEELLVWNLEIGKLDSAPIMFVDSDAEAMYEVINLYFSDGTKVGVISEHGFWDYDLNKYVYLDKDAANYIGHTFAKQNGDVLEKVQLVDVVIENQITTAWSPVTVGHLCYFVNGMLSMPGGVGGLFNIFEVDSNTMMYDYESIAEDIETYGLFTYEELNNIVPLSKDMFDAAGGQYLKISIGKGNMTIYELIEMINRYTMYFE